jgi:replicative DNA helicase
MSYTREPPHSLESEVAVIGTVLVAAAECLPQLAELQPDEFMDPGHTALWEAIRAVEKDKGYAAVNTITVWEALKVKGDTSRVKDGQAGLVAMMGSARVPQQVEFYAQIVREKALLRKAIAFAAEVQLAAYSESAAEILARLWTGVGKLATIGLLKEPVRIADAIAPAAEVIEQRSARGGRCDVATHIGNFDRVFDGCKRDEFTIVASPPGVGKSALGGTILRNAAVKGKVPGLIVSQEMGLQELVERIVAGQCATPIDKIAGGQAWREFHMAAGVLEQAPLWIEETPMTIEQLVGTVHRWFARYVEARHPKGSLELPLGIVLVDYLQIIGVTEEMESRERELAHISRSLKMLAKTIHSPVIGISSLNRVGQRKGGVPQLIDLRGSGAIEYDADRVFFLHRELGEDPEAANKPGPAKLICSKNRGGRTGFIDLYYEGDWTTFRELDTREEEWKPEKSFVDGKEHAE